jgi:hypothetical protein
MQEVNLVEIIFNKVYTVQYVCITVEGEALGDSFADSEAFGVRSNSSIIIDR